MIERCEKTKLNNGFSGHTSVEIFPTVRKKMLTTKGTIFKNLETIASGKLKLETIREF